MAFKRYIEISAGPADGIGRTVVDNYMGFEIEKSLGPKWINKAIVQIYNLSDNTANIMGAAKNKLIVKTGYSDEGVQAIFFGDVHKSKIYKEGPNKILEIEAYDGQKAQSKSIALSYTEGTSASVILDAILAKLAYPVKNKPKLNDVYQNAYSFSGNAYDALKKVLAKSGYLCSIQNEAIIIYKQGEAVVNTGLYLSADTGLIQADVVDEIVGFLIDDDALPDRKGSKLKIKSLIYPQLYPGAQITVAKGLSEGPYRIKTVKMIGDNFGGDYFAEMEATRL